jgi:hypothetical protein
MRTSLFLLLFAAGAMPLAAQSRFGEFPMAFPP